MLWFDYYVSGQVYVVYCGSVILVCEYLRSVLDVLMKWDTASREFQPVISRFGFGFGLGFRFGFGFRFRFGFGFRFRFRFGFRFEFGFGFGFRLGFGFGFRLGHRNVKKFNP